jgi:hypothetical protein
MCFSPQADLVGGAIVGAIGIDVVRHVRGRSHYLALASLPLLLGVHQLIEAFVWWSLQGHVPHELGRVALWAYLLIAFVVLPILVPTAVLIAEHTTRRRWAMVPFVVLGTGVAVDLFVAMLRGPVSVALRPYHLSYTIRPSHGLLLICLYVVAVCGALLLSGYRDVMIFGLVNLAAIGVIAWLTADGFASVWCGWAAISSAAIAVHMRTARPHAGASYALG